MRGDTQPSPIQQDEIKKKGPTSDDLIKEIRDLNDVIFELKMELTGEKLKIFLFAS